MTKLTTNQKDALAYVGITGKCKHLHFQTSYATMAYREVTTKHQRWYDLTSEGAELVKNNRKMKAHRFLLAKGYSFDPNRNNKLSCLWYSHPEKRGSAFITGGNVYEPESNNTYTAELTATFRTSNKG